MFYKKCLLFLLVIAWCGCKSERQVSSERCSWCKVKLNSLGQALDDYVRMGAEIPIDESGQPDWPRILAEGVDFNDFYCPASKSGSGYVFKRDLARGDLRADSADNIVIGMDGAKNHSAPPHHDGSEREYVNVLLAGGNVMTKRVDLETAKQWRAVLLEGKVLNLNKN